MKRNSFLKACISTAAFLSLPFGLISKSLTRARVDKGFMVNSGKDRFDKTLTPFEGDTFYCKVSTKDTNGDIYVFESTRLLEGGPSLHYHLEQDEWWYVLKGEFEIKVGDNLYKAKAGDSVFGPRMVPHTFAKIGDGEGKLLMFFQPAGKMEEFFTKLNNGMAKKMTEEEKGKFAEEHGFKRVGPPLRSSKKW
jgi:mannose-6-phosphate isomerase-like protein (cupin superfamily)